MQAKNTFSILFWINKAKIRNNEAPIWARVTIDGKRVEISTKRTINPDFWNNEKGLAKGSNADARSINNLIEQVRSRIWEIYQQLLNQKKLVTAELIKNHYLGNEEKSHTLLSLVDYHNTHYKNVMEWGTYKNYLTTQKYISNFVKNSLKTSDIFLSELKYKFLTDFEMYLRNLQPDGNQRACGNNTVMKHIERLRKIINLAVNNEWVERDPFVKYKKNYIRTKRECLTAAELSTIEEKEFKIARLQQVKDLFIFSCYTGLAYIDVMNLKMENVSMGIDGEYWIFTSRQKTDIVVKIPLLPKAFELVEKYKNHPASVAKGTIFPIISNQKLNSYLKEIADLCEITKNLSFHLARHTFATTITLSNGVPIETVSKLLGHTTIRTTQIYAKVIETKVSQDMKALREKINPNIEKEAIKHAV